MEFWQRVCFPIPNWILKCDIRKFFANIDHGILKNILAKYIEDEDALWLLSQVAGSFHAKGKIGVGLPLGNLTSQLLVNIYLNEFDQFVKRNLKARCYARYCDDFVILHDNKNYLESIVLKISEFLENELKLSLHPDKVFIKTMASGVNFLGWVNFSKHRILRTSMKKRMAKKLKKNPKPELIASYLGLLKHGNTHKLKMKLVKYARVTRSPNNY